MPPGKNVLDDLRFDLVLGQIKLGPPLGQSQFNYLFSFTAYLTYNSTQFTAEPSETLLTGPWCNACCGRQEWR
jgi:hypothetical protein